MKVDLRCHWIPLAISALIGLLAFGCGANSGKSPLAEQQDEQNKNDEKGAKKLFGDVVSSSESLPTSETQLLPTSQDNVPLRFSEVASLSGIDFVYETGARGRSLMVETVGGGVGVLDFNRDGLSDMFFCQGGDPTMDDNSKRPPSAIYLNTHPGRFLNVYAQAVELKHGYAQGVSVGDYNADGFEDVYVTCVGENAFLENKGDGTFVEITEHTGVAGSRWSTSAAFSDLTGDGLLDIYVCNYLIYDPKRPLDCRNSKGEYRICHPRELDPWPDDCYVNQGDGTFREQAAQLGLKGEGNKALGVATADFNNDGLTDVYVANDTTANFLFINQNNGRFKELAMLLGCASNYEGLNQASMGLAVGDYDRNGWLDIYSTHFYEESNTLYRNLGKLGFQDVTGSVGLHEPTLQSLGFGVIMQDFNQDGMQDIFVTNGHVDNYPNNPILNMRPQLFRFDRTKWHDVSLEGGAFFDQKRVGRGVASLDFDGDGDLDLAVVHQNSPAALLRNDSLLKRWLKVTFVGRQSPRDGTGCRVTLNCGSSSEMQELIGGGSYLSASEKTLVFGIPSKVTECTVDVKWPSGKSQSLVTTEFNQTLVLEEPAAP